jgi:flagellar biosynthesis/type III secretory pathway M-ring protein FliF/YscJ
MISDPHGPQIGHMSSRSNLSSRPRNSSRHFQERSSDQPQPNDPDAIRLTPLQEASTSELLEGDSTPEAANPSNEMPSPHAFPSRLSYKTVTENTHPQSRSIDTTTGPADNNNHATSTEVITKTVERVEQVKTVERVSAKVVLVDNWGDDH